MTFTLTVFCHYAECRIVYEYAECHNSECLYIECPYADCFNAKCRNADCRGVKFSSFILSISSFLRPLTPILNNKESNPTIKAGWLVRCERDTDNYNM